MGVMPGIKSGTVWRTPWAMMDFDYRQLFELKPFFDLLLDRGFSFAYSTGTTKSGAHLWFLLDHAITLRQAHRGLKFLKEVAAAMNLSGIDLRPDEQGEKGAGIMLPYRGAAKDYAGANPLYSAATGAQIPLSELPAFPRQGATMFAQLGGLKSVERFIAGFPSKEQLKHAPPLDSEIPTSAEVWKVELERLSALWKRGRRHSLVKAASAFGLFIGIDPEQLRDDLVGLMESNNDEQLEDRKQVIDLAIKRHEQHHPLAFISSYAEAGVQTPTEARSAAVQPLVIGGLELLMNTVWRGRAGKTDRSVYKTLLRLSGSYGYEHTCGVEISLAWSTLSVEANVGSDDTLNKSLARLEAADLLRRGAASLAGKSGSFVLLLTNRRTHLRGGEEQQRVKEESFCLSSALRNGANRLGKTKEEVLDLLVWNGEMSLAGLAAKMDTRSYDLRKRLVALVNRDLISWNGRAPDSLIRTVPDFQTRLEEIQKSDGSEAAKETQKQHNLRKSKKFQTFLQQRG